LALLVSISAAKRRNALPGRRSIPIVRLP